MPKMKTRRGARKRFRLTASGKIKRKRGYLRHILSSKTRRQKRRLRSSAILENVDARGIRRLLPYG
ncbi:MAG: 50S ribosomal protein L35 [Deltaproteobacteria bacterium]|nr:50S ribosomal protein L35 [Deltaproteobacteria bacterium]